MKQQVFIILVTFLIFSFSSVTAQHSQFKKQQKDLCPSGNSQSRHLNKSQTKFGAGVKAGLNYATQYTSGTASNVEFKSMFGYNAGAYCNYFLLDFLALQSELMASAKGSYWKNQFYDAKYNLTYIDLPVLVKFQPVEWFNIHAGPQFSYLLFATQKDFGTNLKTNVLANYYKFDTGLVFGVEANLPSKINLTIRYILGLNTATTGAPYTETWKNKLFQISLGYRILGR